MRHQQRRRAGQRPHRVVRQVAAASLFAVIRFGRLCRGRLFPVRRFFESGFLFRGRLFSGGFLRRRFLGRCLFRCRLLGWLPGGGFLRRRFLAGRPLRSRLFSGGLLRRWFLWKGFFRRGFFRSEFFRSGGFRFGAGRFDFFEFLDFEGVRVQLIAEDDVEVLLDDFDGCLLDFLEPLPDGFEGGIAPLGVGCTRKDVVDLPVEFLGGRFVLVGIAFGLQERVELLTDWLRGLFVFGGSRLGAKDFVELLAEHVHHRPAFPVLFEAGFGRIDHEPDALRLALDSEAANGEIGQVTQFFADSSDIDALHLAVDLLQPVLIEEDLDGAAAGEVDVQEPLSPGDNADHADHDDGDRGDRGHVAHADEIDFRTADDPHHG